MTSTVSLDQVRTYVATALYCPGVVDVAAWAERHYAGGFARLSTVVAEAL